MKKNKVIKFFVLIIILTSLMYIFQNTYSKYIEEENDSTSLNISKWNIKVNDESIANNVDLMGLIEIEDIDNNNIENGFIAPTYEAKFSINIDSTGTDVPYKYKIELADGITTNSNYTLTYKRTNGSGVYYYDLYFETYDYDYNLNNSSLADKQPEFKFYVGSDFDISKTEIWWGKDLKYDGTYLTLNTYFWTWSGWDEATHKNTFSNELNIGFTHALDYNPFGNIILDGKTFSNDKVPDFKITGYAIEDGPRIDLPSDEYFVEGIVEPKAEDVTVKNNYTFYLQWYDGVDELMNNEEDVEAAKPNDATGLAVTSIPIKVTITQATQAEVDASKVSP